MEDDLSIKLGWPLMLFLFFSNNIYCLSIQSLQHETWQCFHSTMPDKNSLLVALYISVTYQCPTKELQIEFPSFSEQLHKKSVLSTGLS